MRSRPASFLFMFCLPRLAPAAEGCTVRFSHPVFVEVEGPSRQAVQDHAARFLRALGPTPPFSLHGILQSPAGAPSGRDSWNIIVNADVAFSPASIDAFIPADE